jgi:hypothetical protein
MEALQVLSRSEMKKIRGGYSGCGSYCQGCIENGSIGADPPCYKWTCQGGMCVPVADNCCVKSTPPST